MYYAEKIIDGVLCCKHMPNAEWKPLSAKQLTNQIVRLECEVRRLTL